MEIQLSAPAALETEIRLARPPKVARASDFVSRLQVMQTILGADHFAVLRVAGHGLPSTRKLTLSLHNWASDVDGNARALIETYGAAMLAHLEASMLPLIWEGAGDNQFVETPASGPPQDGVPNTDGMGDLQQGNLEQANVEAVTEISDLIAAQRAYEMNGKVITAADQMLQASSNLMR